MTTSRSTGFIAAALMTAASSALLCCREAWAQSLAEGDVLASAPADAPRRPLQLMHERHSWLGGTAPSLHGKVVVVNFWTYSCINSLRALPYLKAWDKRYRDKGLEIIGAHAPEFGFERDPVRVRAATQALGIAYPNFQDNEYAVWRAFGNEGWPGFYVIDASGRVRGYMVGEGHYAEAEQLIRSLLAEAGHDLSSIPISPVIATGVEAQADWASLQSPEAYIGYAKAQGFASPGGLARDGSRLYTPTSQLSLDRWDLAGNWTDTREFARLDTPGGAIRYRFHARDVHAVLGVTEGGPPVRFRVTIDGAAPGADHGTDVDADGWGELRQDRLYQLIRQHGVITDRTIRIEFSRPGAQAYSFTFG